MKKLAALVGACALTACTSLSPTLPTSHSEDIKPLQIQVEHEGQVLSERTLSDFWVQRLTDAKGSGLLKHALSKFAKSWYEHPRHPNARRSPELLITDVQLTDSGVSIMGKDAPGSIVPDYAGKEVRLTLKGVFKHQRQALKLRSFLFTLEAPLVQQTFAFEGKEPHSRVLLNDSVLLEPVSVSATEIEVVLQTKYLLDLYLRGLHKITVEHDAWYTDALVQVGEPVPTNADLRPRIDSTEILYKRGKPLHVRLEGAGFFVFPKLVYATVDGEFGFSDQTEVLDDGTGSIIVHIPDPAAFARQSTHTIMLATPFGVAFKTF